MCVVTITLRSAILTKMNGSVAMEESTKKTFKHLHFCCAPRDLCEASLSDVRHTKIVRRLHFDVSTLSKQEGAEQTYNSEKTIPHVLANLYSYRID